MVFLIRKMIDMTVLKIKQTKNYDPSWAAFTVTGRGPNDMGICNVLENFCEDEFYVNQNRVMLQANDAKRMEDQQKIAFDEGEYILHRFENQNVLKDLADQMRKKFPKNKVSYEESFFFNQHDYSPNGSDKIGWVYIELDLLDEVLERYTKEAKGGNASEELTKKMNNFVLIMKEVPNDCSALVVSDISCK